MIKKIDGVYVMDEVCVPTITTYALDKGEEKILRIAPDIFIRRFCGGCGNNERPDVFSVQAFSPDPDDHGVWICDVCVEEYAPDLMPELKAKREAHYKKINEEMLADQTFPLKAHLDSERENAGRKP